MKIKLSQELIKMLRRASIQYDFNYSEIAGKALRKYKRLLPELPDTPSTYKGETYRFSIKTDFEHSEIRAILHWYLELTFAIPLPKPFVTDKIAGKDYIII